ncbi:homoserine O-acetyltransferase MetX [Rhodothermus marinus]|uniref:homoserine O-acetyltransferase MetX n=1 Tax=Rhodothermus marinus TaxID=29549 RepID=UPI000AA179A8|nr:homoserine O-acetyltransferase [Rhodothermus marinus]
MTQTFVLPEFELESGVVLRQVQVAYRTWGRLNPEGTNALVVCHALTGSADVDQWWSDLLGPGRAFDTDRFFVVCANVLGSPYGTTSPLTINPDTGRPYGPEFPLVTIRDTVNLHRRLLEHLGVRQVAVAVGGSMGGMQVLEWAFQGDFVRAIIPIAVGGRHSAWCIGWSEAQRQAIYADPRWRGGYYDPDDPPVHGLAIARMIAMISYRSYQSFEARFGRRRMLRGEEELFAVESYLHYQGEKLVRRFDANCYVRLTQKMDSHDVSRGRGPYPEVLAEVRQPALVVGIDSDVLYPLAEQEELATHLQRLVVRAALAPRARCVPDRNANP